MLRGALIIFLTVWGGVGAAACARDTVTVVGMQGPVAFTVELAITPEERSRGLMFRESMAEDAGMLFLFERSARRAFWMKNTLIPLDILFITERGVVRHVHENAIPHDETSIRSRGPAMAVLEINGGLARRLGIATGSVVQHPLLPQDRAALPC